MADYTVNTANVLKGPNGTIQVGTVGVGSTIATGKPVAKDSDGTLKLADANAAAPLNSVEGISLNSAEPGQPINYVSIDPSFTPGFAVAAGATVVLSRNAGLMCPVADLVTGDFLTIIGVGIGSNKINLRPFAAGVATP